MENLFSEHHLYLPLFGYAIMLPVVSLRFARRMNVDKRLWLLFIVILLAAYSLATHHRNKVWQTEISLWEDTVKKSPRHARTNYTLGVYYFKAKRYQDAINRYERALFYKKDYPEAYYRLGEYYFELKQPERAIENYKKALAIKPNFFEAHLNLASTFLYLKRYQEARESFNNALRFTKDAGHINNINSILEKMRRYE